VGNDAGVVRLTRDLKKRAELRHHTHDIAPIALSTAPSSKLIRILHLSDLHFRRGDDHKQLLNILDEDLEDDIDYLVVSGDLSDRCNETGYQNAAKFLSELQTRRSIPHERCILVPGNHDVQRDLGSFEIREKIDNGDDAVIRLWQVTWTQASMSFAKPVHMQTGLAASRLSTRSSLVVITI
jgi:Icc-related predicted phosphoesterase